VEVDLPFSLGKLERLHSILEAAPFIPLLSTQDAAEAVAAAGLFREAGITALQIPIHTPAGPEVLRTIVDKVSDVAVGAGSVLLSQHVDEAVSAGASFLMSPGVSPRLMAAVAEVPVPYLPGVATLSELLQLAEQGATFASFCATPSSLEASILDEASKGLPLLRFVATSAREFHLVRRYFDHPSVVSVSGPWNFWGQAAESDGLKSLVKRASGRISDVPSADPVVA
jgi:2-dehydro-3-deoxyphosphogluconate aldolase/(4S)-4-hydroxy-2-oxoglutarate aldolase